MASGLANVNMQLPLEDQFVDAVTERSAQLPGTVLPPPDAPQGVLSRPCKNVSNSSDILAGMSTNRGARNRAGKC